MPHERGVQSASHWRQEADTDGWKWTDPNWESRVSTDSLLALALEALRHGIDLRDAAAESGEEDELTARALILMSIINRMYEHAVRERARSEARVVEVPHGNGAEIATRLAQLGLLRPEEYRPAT